MAINASTYNCFPVRNSELGWRITGDNDHHFIISSYTKFRAGDGGIHTFTTDNSNDPVLPSVFGYSPNLQTIDVEVKRPNCQCTILTKGKIKYKNDVSHYFSNGTAYIRNFTFNDGYVFMAGDDIQILLVDPNNDVRMIAKKLVLCTSSDMILCCDNIGISNLITTGCRTLVGSVVLIADDIDPFYLTEPKTSFPQNEFNTSHVRSVIMLENGVYVVDVPHNGVAY